MPMFSINGRPVFPHIKLTRENFPRALATRILKDDGDEYFGAFLNRTNVRILIDFLNRTFRLRTCTIAIDGSFPVPCTQYHARRCVAPCVVSLCDAVSYNEIVDLVRLFLRNDRELFVAAVSRKIDRASEDLDFETAAHFRDVLQNVESFWSNARWNVWLDDTLDSYELDVTTDVIYVILITQRRSRSLGEIVFAFDRFPDSDPTIVLRDVIDQFYKHHVPRAIVVSHDFAGRPALAKELGKRSGRKIAITILNASNRRITTERAVDRIKARVDIERKKAGLALAEPAEQIAVMLGLHDRPHRIEAFDVAHISATGFAAAVSAWQGGQELPDEYEHWLSDRTSELETLGAFISKRVHGTKANLLVIDGGKMHLRVAMEAVAAKRPQPIVISAVKPKGKHASISHFLTEDGRRIDFDPDDTGHRLLVRLRDDAHSLANATHRLSRDMMHFYELAAILPSLNEREREMLLKDVGSIRRVISLDADQLKVKLGTRKGKLAAVDLDRYRRGEADPPRPLIVPIRYVETDGAAEDLIPIETR